MNGTSGQTASPDTSVWVIVRFHGPLFPIMVLSNLTVQHSSIGSSSPWRVRRHNGSRRLPILGEGWEPYGHSNDWSYVSCVMKLNSIKALIVLLTISRFALPNANTPNPLQCYSFNNSSSIILLESDPGKEEPVWIYHLGERRRVPGRYGFSLSTAQMRCVLIFSILTLNRWRISQGYNRC